MTKKELKIISLNYRTLSSQMLKINTKEDIRYIKIFMDFINQTELILSYINECHKNDYDFKQIIETRGYGKRFELPDNTEDTVDYCYQLLMYIIENNIGLIGLTFGYSKSNKLSDSISAFMRKTIEPFVIAIKNHLEIKLIETDDVIVEDANSEKTMVFLSYCQKDSPIADIVDSGIMTNSNTNKLTITRDIRDVEFHQSFKKFMDSIEDHDYVIMLISDRYLKSRNCLYEVLETIKDSKFKDRLVYIILSNDDAKYFGETDEKIGADVYSVQDHTNYIMYWKNEEKKINHQIEIIDDSVASIELIKELKHIRKITFDLPELLEFIKDYKGLSLQEHIDSNFDQILKFMQLK